MNWTLAVAGLLIASASIARAQNDSALVYETTTRTSMALGMFGDAVTRTRTVESKLGIREEVLEKTGPSSRADNSAFARAGSYRLTLESGATYLVDPTSREYYVFDLSGMDTVQLSAGFKNFEKNMSANSNTDVDSVGAGDVIAGQPTTRWKIHEVVRIAAKNGGDSVITGEEMTTDAYYATAIPHITHALLDESRIGAKGRRKLPHTIELRSVSKGTMSMPGMAVPMQITKEVTQISIRQLDASLFAVPKDFKKVEMPFPGGSDLNSH